MKLSALAISVVLALACSVHKVHAQTASFNLTNIASFRGDYSEVEPGIGWRYLWNALGPIGNLANYVDMGWNGEAYELSSDPDYPSAPPASYLLLDRFGGHPGLGSGQSGGVGNTFSRYAIMSYKVSRAGPYSITDSFVYRHAGALNGSDIVRVYVNNTQIGSGFVFQSSIPQSFDQDLGVLNVGDRIFLAVGPNGSDENDSFAIDFSIATVPAILLSIMALRNEVVLSWPVFPSALVERAPRVLGPWDKLQGTVFQEDGRHQMRIQISEPGQFFRLRVFEPGPPTIVQHPKSQTVSVGDAVTFSATITNTAALPVTYRWRKRSSTLAVQELNQWTSTFTITNVQSTTAGDYTVVVSNPVFPSPGFLSETATLEVEELP